MKYMGSKARLAKDISPFLKSANGFYYEPFAGGMNMISQIPHQRMIVANDSNPYLIAMFQELMNGWVPDDYYEKDFYNFVRVTHLVKTVPDYVVGWLGFNCSYSGKWFGGFAGKTQTKDGVRDYQAEAKRHMMKQILTMKNRNIIFNNENYDQMKIVDESTVYCDPPYESTTGYKDTFDHVKFWEWVRNLSVRCSVFVSEYNAPDDFECIWEKPVKSSLSANGSVGGSKNSVERLFRYKMNVTLPSGVG